MNGEVAPQKHLRIFPLSCDQYALDSCFHPPSPHPPVPITDLIPVPINLSFLGILCEWNHTICVLCSRLLLFSVVLLNSFYVEYIKGILLLLLLQITLHMWLYVPHMLLIHLLADGCGLFYIVIYLYIYIMSLRTVPCFFVFLHVFISHGWMSRDRLSIWLVV